MTTETFQLSRANLRDANSGDVAGLQALDEACFEYCWAKSEFAEALKSRGATTIMVVVHDDKIIAFMVFIRAPKQNVAQVLRIAVAENFRRRKIGTQLIKVIKQELDARTKLRMCVQESDLAGALFLKALGFSCVATRPGYYKFGDDTQEAAYEFEFGASVRTYQPPGSKRGQLTVSLKNRISVSHGGRRPKDDDDADAGDEYSPT